MNRCLVGASSSVDIIVTDLNKHFVERKSWVLTRNSDQEDVFSMIIWSVNTSLSPWSCFDSLVTFEYSVSNFAEFFSGFPSSEPVSILRCCVLAVMPLIGIVYHSATFSHQKEMPCSWCNSMDSHSPLLCDYIFGIILCPSKPPIRADNCHDCSFFMWNT